MKTRIFTLLFALVASVGTLFAESGTCGANLTWNLTDSILTISGIGAMENYGAKDVPWSSYASSITTVVISNSVTTIGDAAFFGCSNLTAVVIGNSVTNIGHRAFFKCKALTSIAIPNSVTNIGDQAFSRCTSLTSVTIPNSVTAIGQNAFYGCTSLTYVTIPNSVTNIGNAVFGGCTSLTSPVYNARIFACLPISYSGAYTIPDGIEFIAGSAFLRCTGLTSVTIPNSVTTIGAHAFSGCTSLTSATIPNSVTAIGGSAFYGCTSLTSPVYNARIFAYLPISYSGAYAIPDGIEIIAGSAFLRCTGLTSVTILNSVTNIGDQAFSGCTSLTYVTIPNSVTNIGIGAFEGCTSLTSVRCKAEVPPTLLGYYVFENVLNATLYVPMNSVDEYQNSKWAQYFTNISGFNSYSVLFVDREGRLIESQSVDEGDAILVPEAPDVFGYTFIGWDNDLSNVTENIVVVTAQYTRDAINGLYYIYDREAQTAVLDREDNNYEGITNLTVPNTITYRGTKFTVVAIGEHALEGCDRLTDVVIPNSVENIMPYAFAGCSDMVRLNLGGGIRSVADHAFDGCKRLEDITVYAERVPDLTATSFANVGNKQYINVYVPEARLQFYQRDEYWSEFYLKVKSAEHVDNQTRDEVTVLPDDNSAVFTWPTQTNAETYTIVITKDGEVFCTLIFNANGQLTGIAFAPGKNGTKSPAMATWVNGGMQFTVTGLDAATQYGYELTTKDASSNIIAEYNGSFETIGSTEGLDDTNANVKMKKVIRNGQIIIMRSDKSYTVMGQETR